MPIVHRHDKDGGFIAGDTTSLMTCYAYPTSPHARKAKRSADMAGRVAREMIAGEQRHGAQHERVYDERNWKRLNYKGK